MALSPRVVDLLPYELLESVAETGSISRCARRHGVSQVAVSARMKALERRLGVRLLQRTTRGAALTEAGALVLEWARPVLARAAALDEAIAALTGGQPDELALAASSTIAEYLLPGWLAGLRSRWPELRISLHSANSAQVLDSVRAGDARLGFIETGQPPPELRATPVGRDRLVVLVAPDHPWARRRAIAPVELAEAPLITREQGSGTRTALEQHLARLGQSLSRRGASLELTSSTAIKNAVAGGLGPAVLSSLAVADELADGRLRQVAVRGSRLERVLHAVWPPGHHLPDPARALLAATGASGRE
jgi:DNA-binding transcriptional LysR family regulator